MKIILLLVLVVLIATGLAARFQFLRAKLPNPLVTTSRTPVSNSPILFVLVHGLSPEGMEGVEAALETTGGGVLRVKYPAGLLSDADPDEVALGISAAIQHEWEREWSARPQSQIVLVGHSMGALLARKAFLIATTTGSWTQSVKRIVLLAGMNRGWDVTGQKPSDMGWGRYFGISIGSWLGRFVDRGRLVLAMETGAPFVANLRLEWMDWFRKNGQWSPEVVQLLGDIDDLVSDEDNKDLRVAPEGKFAWVKVRGTGHGGILDFSESRRGLGAYRRQKLLDSATKPFDVVSRMNEEQPFQADKAVTHVVFVLHGIRDLGEWSAQLEQALMASFERSKTAAHEKLAVASVRYGFFGMGPFILRLGRAKYVRWFMDTYTETIARYPNAKQIDFVGHSNGTYLLARALADYKQMRIRNVVFAGSVVPRNYSWDRIFCRGQVSSVRNYVAADDWVVALFPAFFEQPVMRLLGNDIGSAGFNGFTSGNAARPDGFAAVPDAGVAHCDSENGQASQVSLRVHNVGFLRGGHGAFLGHIPSIVDFLLPAQDLRIEPPTGRGPAGFGLLLWGGGRWLVWIVLVACVVWTGARLVTAGEDMAWLVFIGYVALVVAILRTL